MPDLFAQLKDKDKTTNFRQTLLDLFDKMLSNAGITDPAKLGILARLRARIDIDLKDF